LNEVIEVDNEFYILAGSSFSDDRSFVLKDGDMFGLFDHYGDIRPFGLREQGIYYEGTRFLSALDLRIENKRPLFLSSVSKTGNDILAVDLSNPDLLLDHDDILIPRGTVYVGRYKFLWNGACYERLEISNFGIYPVEFRLFMKFEADFADIFEVRGTQRSQRGKQSGLQVLEDGLVFSYIGLDAVERTTRISFQPAPTVLSADGTVRFDLRLHPRSAERIYICVSCEIGLPSLHCVGYDAALQTLSQEAAQLRSEAAEIESSKGAFNDSLERGASDILMMLTRTPHGLYPYAGVPWFSVPFGRDGIITALEMLWVNPSIARGVLGFLAATQATETDDSADATPGKIVHEMRRGEMAALGEIPFRQYYGSVDSTPLFVMLAGAYYTRTADRAFIESLWPNIEAALKWIDAYGDSDGDGFVEYARNSDKGLIQQGWKDSRDSVSHSDGRLADAPVALCEVQGYAYAAKRAAAQLCLSLGDWGRAEELEKQAQGLKIRFDKAFWCEEKSTYAIGLDGSKSRCEVRSSNPGHCLYTGIANPDRVARIVKTLTSETSFSGWGIRTLDSSEVRYNPMSYHNGSIWPHDNAMIAYGFSLFGFQQEALRVFTAIFDLSQSVRLNRLPELICGFPRLERQGPTLYPVACSPQAWAAGSIHMMLEACLGLRIDAPSRSIRFEHPVLPPFIKELRIRNLRVGSALVDLTLHRYPDNVGINVDRRTGPVEIVALQ
jgi:glycogen debranching enzyme